jgi:signal transduction histidine kinase
LQEEIRARERLIQDLDAFAHTVAHDLKNPLSVVEGYTDLIVMDLEALDGANVRETMKFALKIRTTIKTMTRIINELLTLASVRQRDVELQRLNMQEIVTEARRRLAQKIDETGAVITAPDTWPEALGYAPWIEEVWTNYLSNALKYGGEAPRIELGASVEDGLAHFWVRDWGPGIPPEKQSQLFMAFNRLGIRVKEGHGLGLALVKRILEKLGGEVGVESTGVPGEGSTFYFVLPTAESDSS